MMHEVFDKKIDVVETDITFEQIYKKNYAPVEYLEEIKKANLLIIPNEGFCDEGDVLFPETTRDFFDFIREFAGEEVIADIAISDQDFQRIQLHSALIDLATIIIELPIYDIAIGLVTSFLYDLLKKYRRSAEETSARVKIITEETETKRSKLITYEGPVAGIKDALEQAAKDLFSKD